ncbi:hypothetical protein ACFIOY_36585 [Bradyrhizobium sp. TZ2]
MAVHMPNCLLTGVPYGADQTVYLVFDSFGASRSDCPEKGIERDDLETIISDLLTGQFNAPVRVMAFNTLEHWIEDVSNQVVEEIKARCDIDGVSVPEHVRDFVASHTGFAESRGCEAGDRQAVASSTAELPVNSA